MRQIRLYLCRVYAELYFEVFNEWNTQLDIV